MARSHILLALALSCFVSAVYSAESGECTAEQKTEVEKKLGEAATCVNEIIKYSLKKEEALTCKNTSALKQKEDAYIDSAKCDKNVDRKKTDKVFEVLKLMIDKTIENKEFKEKSADLPECIKTIKDDIKNCVKNNIHAQGDLSEKLENSTSFFIAVLQYGIAYNPKANDEEKKLRKCVEDIFGKNGTCNPFEPLVKSLFDIAEKELVESAKPPATVPPVTSPAPVPPVTSPAPVPPVNLQNPSTPAPNITANATEATKTAGISSASIPVVTSFLLIGACFLTL